MEASLFPPATPRRQPTACAIGDATPISAASTGVGSFRGRLCRPTTGRRRKGRHDGTPVTGMDAAFLYLETRAAHMHVAMVGIYDVSTMRDGYSFEALKQHIAERLHIVPPFRRRLVEVPFQFHHPVWIEDPDFDLDYHVRRVTAPRPGGRRELGDGRREIASVPLDRSRPLWEAWVVEGLKHDRVGFIVKVHHAAIDGASGAEIMTALYDLSPDAPRSSPSRIAAGAGAERGRAAVLRGDVEAARAATPCRCWAAPWGRRRRWCATSSTTGRSTAVCRSPHRARRSTTRSDPRAVVAFARIPLDRGPCDRRRRSGQGQRRDPRGVRRHAAPLPGGCTTRCPTTRCWWCAPCRCASRTTGTGNKVSAMFASLPDHLDDPTRAAARHLREHRGGEGGPQRRRRPDAHRLGRVGGTPHLRTGATALQLDEPGRQPPTHPQPGDLERARPAVPALPGRRRAGRRLPDGTDHGRGRAEHHGPVVPEPHRHRLPGRCRAGARHLGRRRAGATGVRRAAAGGRSRSTRPSRSRRHRSPAVGRSAQRVVKTSARTGWKRSPKAADVPTRKRRPEEGGGSQGPLPARKATKGRRRHGEEGSDRTKKAGTAFEEPAVTTSDRLATVHRRKRNMF
jgi:hypothetical protein